jgi:TatD DNase family protein
MLVDSHCHLDRLDLTPYDDDFSRFMAETAEHRIEHLLCVSIDLESYPNMRSLVDGYENISVSVGVHPNEWNGREPAIEDLIKLADDPKVVAIGETGLDYYRSEGDLRWQQERFRRHIQAAKATGKPLIIHTREARKDTLEILAEEGADEVGGVVHCFTEDWDTAKRALDLNFYISFSGIVTFKNAHAIQDAAKKVPEDRFLIETDSPYLAPMPHRGKPNYPFYVHHVAGFLGKLREVPLDVIAALSTRNFYSLFPVDQI